MIRDVSEDEVRELNDEPAKPGIFLKKRKNVVGMFVVPKRWFVSAKLILFRVSVTLKSGILAAVVLVVCRMCCSHGYSPNQGTPPIVFQDETMNQVGGEFKTKIGKCGSPPPIKAAKRFARRTGSDAGLQ